ncbi:hypothetical protein [Spirosoma endophyticum]|uniref:Uncharacterized protein n=1 Tax=Spirosoma endophyticum TaxID=662367 RepID=A0A1I2HDQ7_9BACT|nr:hypothetical protein [Spirosoma endophyticum]SFF27440.1 hypothetical protein SAMN05216167_14110 [Spirosoma endophyticum]
MIYAEKKFDSFRSRGWRVDQFLRSLQNNNVGRPDGVLAIRGPLIGQQAHPSGKGGKRNGQPPGQGLS